ncbi:uncharacterized protein LOC142169851 [Nicotiana tabacum]|uniref:Uncharacterized protein LOC142169851 n=1 Tax=Nicotiana tabacum TaxID=4097 RepID=A0AC58SSE2_TOBAC
MHVWEDLWGCFDKVNRVRIFQLHREIATISQGTDSVSIYFTRLKELWAEYNAMRPSPNCGCAKSKKIVVRFLQQHLLQFLSGLNDSYDQARRQILVKTTELILNQAYAKIIESESQLTPPPGVNSIAEGNDITSLWNAKGTQQKPKRNFNLYCEHCKLKCHTKENCYQLVGYPPNYKGRKKNGATANNMTANNMTSFGRQLDQNSNMILGQHYHGGFISDSQGFATLDQGQGIMSSVVVGQSATNMNAGASPMVFTQEQYNQILKMLSKGNSTKATANAVGIVTPSLSNDRNDKWIDLHIRKVKGIGRIEEDRYHWYSKNKRPPSLVPSVFLKVHDEDELWHKRLGYVSWRILRQLSLVRSNMNNTKSSIVCPLAKNTRIPFPISNSRAAKPFDLSDVSTILKEFLLLVQTHFNTSIKVFRSDNGIEFFNSFYKALFSNAGIIHQSSYVHTPPQNRVVERKHKHILEVTRALRFQAGLPLRFWGICIFNVVYLINRIPSPVLGNKSPFEIFFGRQPNLAHLRFIGSLCYATITGAIGDKFGPRAEAAVHMGYFSTQKGYKLYSFSRKMFFICRDVIFKEDVFPFKSSQTSNAYMIPACSAPTPHMDPLSELPSTQDGLLTVQPSWVDGPSVEEPDVSPESFPSQSGSPIHGTHSGIHDTDEAPNPVLSSPEHFTQSSYSVASHSSPTNSPDIPYPQPRITARTFRPHGWLNDFVQGPLPSDHTSSSCIYPMSNYMCYTSLSASYLDSICSYYVINELDSL